MKKLLELQQTAKLSILFSSPQDFYRGINEVINMTFQEYRKLVKEVQIGKHLPAAIYLHKSAIGSLPIVLQNFFQNTIEKLNLAYVHWNIIKLSKKDFKISILYYPTFFHDSYPPLHSSNTIDLEKWSVRKSSYEKSSNPPILHRKETFLEPDHPSVQLFKEITKEGEEAGLYKNAHTIGFRKSWERLISQNGLILVDGRLQKEPPTQPSTSVKTEISCSIERHKTAIDRGKLSAPMQSLLRHNYLQGQYVIFDYGCGKADDLNILQENGIEASGWDPVYKPDDAKQNADIVNLGFVINVIENQQERKTTLRQAYKLANKILVVSAMLGGESITSQYKKYGDGIVTSRNTFQKYYTQRELKNYIAGILGEEPIAVGPGIFYVFKDEIEEQNFLVQRQTNKKTWLRLSYSDHPEKLKIKQRSLLKRHRELFDDFWDLCLELGRLPANNEFEFSERIRVICGSHARALNVLTTFYGEEAFKQAAQRRHDDLLVYFALSLFGRRKPYIHMPESLQRDIKTFFGKYTDAITQAKNILFSVGKPENIHKACVEFYNKVQKGRMEEGHSLTIHRDYLNALPVVLRIYTGCATQLYGDVENADLIKIHIRSGKVSLMRYDDFENEPLPLLLERIKIKLREQQVDFFDYNGKFEPQPIYLKSIYLSEHFPNYNKQIYFDRQIGKFPGLKLDKYGPTTEEFQNFLHAKNLTLRGYQFYNKLEY